MSEGRERERDELEKQNRKELTGSRAEEKTREGQERQERNVMKFNLRRRTGKTDRSFFPPFLVPPVLMTLQTFLSFFFVVVQQRQNCLSKDVPLRTTSYANITKHHLDEVLPFLSHPPAELPVTSSLLSLVSFERQRQRSSLSLLHSVSGLDLFLPILPHFLLLPRRLVMLKKPVQRPSQSLTGSSQFSFHVKVTQIKASSRQFRF